MPRTPTLETKVLKKGSKTLVVDETCEAEFIAKGWKPVDAPDEAEGADAKSDESKGKGKK